MKNERNKFEAAEKGTVEYTDVRITEKSYDPETETLILNVNCIRKVESEHVELTFNPRRANK
jgi:hypothetical protein